MELVLRLEKVLPAETRQYKTKDGEERKIKKIPLILSRGNDTLLVDASGKRADLIEQNSLSVDCFYVCDLHAEVYRSTEGRYFGSIELLSIKKF